MQIEHLAYKIMVETESREAVKLLTPDATRPDDTEMASFVLACRELLHLPWDIKLCWK